MKASDDIYRLLRNKADNPVSLTVNKTPSLTGARIVSYRPITDEANLIYLDWIDRNRRKVETATGGRVGYIHIPDMGANGIREFIKWYYPQIRKEGWLFACAPTAAASFGMLRAIATNCCRKLSRPTMSESLSRPCF